MAFDLGGAALSWGCRYRSLGSEFIAQFAAHGFAGAIKAWLSDDSIEKADLVEAAAACAPAWWT